MIPPDAATVYHNPFDFPAQQLSENQLISVAGMTRHAAKCAAVRAGWSNDLTNAYILGHGEAEGGKHLTVGPRRFAYIPVPSLETRGHGKAQVAGSVRRVIITSFDEGCEDKINWARRALSGQMLEKDTDNRGGNQQVALLSLLSGSFILL